MSKKFPVLTVIALLLRIAGGFAVVLGILFLGLASVTSRSGPGSGQTLLEPLAGPGAFALMFSGLCLYALGEIIGVLFAIEENTRPAEAAGPPERG